MDDEFPENNENGHDQTNAQGKPSSHAAGLNEGGNVVNLLQEAQRREEELRKQEERKGIRILRIGPPANNNPPHAASGGGEPIINMPPATKWLLFAIIAVQLFINFALSPPQAYWAFTHFGFVPAEYTGHMDFTLYSVIAPITYIFLHGSWVHLGMNGVMLAAFGAGVERWLGMRHFLILFFACGLIAAITQTLFSPTSVSPVVGASGGISGLFAAILVMLARMREAGGEKNNMLPFIALWLGITIIFGLIGGPDGSTVAWAAHIGGFLGGFLVLKILRAY